MNFLNTSNNVKQTFRALEKVDSAAASTEIIDDNKQGLYLEINTTFKMIVINYIGDVKLTSSRYNGFLITKSRNNIIIINLRKKTFNNNLLFEFTGNISDFKRVKVFGWGQNGVLAEKTMPSETSLLFDNNDNVVSSYDTRFPVLEDDELLE